MPTTFLPENQTGVIDRFGKVHILELGNPLIRTIPTTDAARHLQPPPSTQLKLVVSFSCCICVTHQLSEVTSPHG